MPSVKDIYLVASKAEQQPDNLEDAIEIIKSLRASVDEQQDYIDALEEVGVKSPDIEFRDMLVLRILPTMINHFRGDLGRDGGDYARAMISAETVKLADAVIREMI